MPLPFFAGIDPLSTIPPPPGRYPYIHVCIPVYSITAFTVLLASVYCISTKQFSDAN